MKRERRKRDTLRYCAEQWRIVDGSESLIEPGEPSTYRNATAREQSRLMDLLGRINYKILTGNRVYVEVGGVVYKTLYGGYWRSVFTGIEHYLLRCEQIQGSLWAEDNEDSQIVDLPIAYSKEGWLASGQSLSFILSRDQ
jgi:hypothetical protein